MFQSVFTAFVYSTVEFVLYCEFPVFICPTIWHFQIFLSAWYICLVSFAYLFLYLRCSCLRFCWVRFCLSFIVYVIINSVAISSAWSLSFSFLFVWLSFYFLSFIFTFLYHFLFPLYFCSFNSFYLCFCVYF